MKESRSASQILFGFLPDQTVDLAGRVWKVREWRSPSRMTLESSALRRELVRLAKPWTDAGTDNDFALHLRQGRPITVLSLDRDNGVSVDPFPEVWMCKACKRVEYSRPETCKCGKDKFGQLPFVGYHECGAIRAPYIAPCPKHEQIEVVLPGTSSAAEILFRCPVCKAELRKGFGFPKCACGGGAMNFNVHRASPVYTPRTVAIVNPISPEKAARLNDAGGKMRALSWVLDDLQQAHFSGVPLTTEGLLRDLLLKGISEEVARSMVETAEKAGEIAKDHGAIDLPADVREEAADRAVTIAMALDGSRVRVDDMVAAVGQDWSEHNSLYTISYPLALKRSGLRAVDLVERFPILTGNFAYTRGGSGPGVGRLNAFTDKTGYVVYGDLSETEALLVRLDPMRVAGWLERRGFQLGAWSDQRSARLTILRSASFPSPGEETPTPTVGSSVLALVHSYAHRLIRRAAVFAGIDRNALSELIVPHHLAFFVYAAPRGDFVLGGLQAVFESELHHLLEDFTGSDHRCPLDPGCQRVGGACMACLHLGEPSCRYYNRYLDRSLLFGDAGYLRLAQGEGAEVVPRQARLT